MTEDEKAEKLLKTKRSILEIDKQIADVAAKTGDLTYEEVRLGRDLTNVIQSNVKDLKLTFNEQRNIQSITKKLNDLAEKTYTFNNKSLGTTTKSGKIQKQIVDAQQKLKILALQKLQIYNKESKSFVEQAGLRKTINQGITEQIALSGRVVQQLEKQAKVAKVIEDNKIASSFGVIGDVLGKIPLLNNFAPAFKDAENAARDVGQEVTLFSRGMMDASDYTMKNMAKMGPDAKVLSNSTYSADDKAVKKMQKKDPKAAKDMIGQRKELFGVAAQKALSKGSAKLVGVNKNFLMIKAALNQIVSVIGKMALLLFVKSLFQANQNITDIQRNLGVGGIEARELNFQFNAIAVSSNDLRVNLKSLFAASKALNESYGTALMFNDETLKTSAKLIDAKLLEGEAVANLSMQSRINGQTMEQSIRSQEAAVNSVNKENNTRISLRGVMKESAKINGQIAAQLQGNPEAIARAVTQAKALGMELSEVAGAAKSLLDFESSIENELTAELMLGKQINLEQARLAALTGDYETVAKEITKQVGDFGEFTKLNVLQQDALAASVGMTSDALSNQLMKKANLDKLAQEALARGDKQQYLDLTALSTQEKMEKLVLKVQDAFVGVASALEPITAILGFVIEVMGTLPGQILIVAGAIMMMTKAAKAFKIVEMVGAVASIFKGSFSRVPNPIAAAAVALAGVGALIVAANKIKSVGDVMSPADGKTQISTKEGGLFQLSKNDDVAAGPGILDKLTGAIKGGPMGLGGGMEGMLNPFSGLTSIISNMAEAIVAKFDIIVGTVQQQLISEPIPVTIMSSTDSGQISSDMEGTQMSMLEKKLDEIKTVLAQRQKITLDVNNKLTYDSFSENTVSYANGKQAQEAINDSSFV